MGRTSHEVSLVMPDGRTVYQSDDGATAYSGNLWPARRATSRQEPFTPLKATHATPPTAGSLPSSGSSLVQAPMRIGADIRQLDTAIAELE
ncbi:MAG: hypothetical protein R3A44_00130 [Caldilineaceae bacterium]